ncbi:tetratricopeptide (TPR) repeat protein [Dysgonomonas sp. PH5-45]|uniref:hypothetical protein n=1 Tax=unclassified Dysgonomonas TaxID=2630389 RepID=UPI0024732C84|nr:MULTISPECIES: hypothetical protein [unclassified Dysgonomonas]MDH6355972.1 tetratricopeptide (TPR) repeat protein [Dysgonomonas sp. PH5-45]MDH6388867.1 tetratricopeptide (TPR) repeat protein [Dysgonomonas sp. PH5-37]
MRKIIIMLLLPFISVCTGFAQENPDYITSGYYQLIYEVNIADSEGNRELAFSKLQQAEQACPIIQQDAYHEMSLYAELLIEKGDYEKALKYITKLVGDYGCNPASFDEFDEWVTPDFKEKVNWKSQLKQLKVLYDNFYTPEREELAKKIKKITEIDQKPRLAISKQREGEALTPEELESIESWRKTDSINRVEMVEIFKKYGYPAQRVIGSKNVFTIMRLTALFLHVSDGEDISDLVLKSVRLGQCSPSLYGLIMDRKNGFYKDNDSTYASAANAEIDNNPDHIAKINARRLAVGMPTIEMSKQETEIFRRKMELSE